MSVPMDQLIADTYTKPLFISYSERYKGYFVVTCTHAKQTAITAVEGKNYAEYFCGPLNSVDHEWSSILCTAHYTEEFCTSLVLLDMNLWFTYLQ